MKRNNKFSKFLLLLPLSIVLTSCDTSGLTEDFKTIESKVIPNVWAFLAQFLAFVIIAVLVIVLAGKPIKKFLDKRRELLNNEVTETHRLNNEAKADRKVASGEIFDAKTKANDIIKAAELKANERREEIIKEAELEARQIREKSLNDIEIAKEKALSELNDQIVDVAIGASSKILEREVNEEDNKKIVNDFINDLKKEDK